MAASVNKVVLVGNLGHSPDIKTTQQGNKIANLSVATSESWTDKATGERKEKTEWHRVVVFNENIVKVCEQYLKKGDKIFVEGQLETRKWTKDGVDRFTTEVVLRPYRGELVMLGSKETSNSASEQGSAQSQASQDSPPNHNTEDDDIPF